jgi:type II secretory pathway pseudopilin PulG
MFLANISDTYGDFQSYYAVTVMGCIDQHQLCSDSNGSSCTPLLGSQEVSDWFSSHVEGLSLTQKAIVERLRSILSLSTLQQSVLGRGYNALQATSSAIYQLGTWEQYNNLPSDQWTIEVSSWFAVQMASLQRSMVQWVSGSSTAESHGSRVQPDSNDVVSAYLCHQQMIPLPSDYQSFHFLGIIIILVVGGVIILLAVTLPNLVVSIKRKRRATSYGWLAWTLDEKLQLHRLAQENSGWGGAWRSQLEAVPTTQEEVLANSGRKTGMKLGLYHVVFASASNNHKAKTDDSTARIKAAVLDPRIVELPEEANSHIERNERKAPSPYQCSITESA